MDKETQIKQVKCALISTGLVSRNWALRNYISRLAAIIVTIKKQNPEWDIRGYWINRGCSGEDFIYRRADKDEKVGYISYASK